MPRRGEPAEVVQADGIDVREQRTDPIDPPSISGPPMRFPIIHGVTPELSVGAERVGGNAGDEPRPTLIVEQEELRIRPHVAGIGGHEERQIADQAHPFRMRVRLQAFALSEQQKLREADLIDLSRQLAPGIGERRRDSLHERRRPTSGNARRGTSPSALETVHSPPTSVPATRGTHRKRSAARASRRGGSRSRHFSISCRRQGMTTS